MESTGILDLPPECVELIISKITDKNELDSVSLVCQQFLHSTSERVHQLKYHSGPLDTLSRMLRRFPNLKRLHLYEPPEGNFTVALDLTADSGLDLEFMALPSRNESFNSFPRELLIKLRSNMPNLKSLHCGYFVEDDYELIALCEIFSERLEELDMSCCGPYVTDEGVETATRMLGGVRRIDISFNNQLCDAWLKSISVNCPTLEEIVACCGHRNSYITHIGVSELFGRCTKLGRATFSEIYYDMPERCLGNALRAAKNLRFIKINSVTLEMKQDCNHSSSEDAEVLPVRTVSELIAALERQLHVA